MKYDEMVEVIKAYMNGEDVFSDFEFTKKFMNAISLFKSDREPYLAVVYYSYVIENDMDSSKESDAFKLAKECEVFEEATNGYTFIEIIQDDENSYDGEYTQVVKHVASGRLMRHTCSTGSYGTGYNTYDSKWVEVFPKERIVIDYVE